jgi:hypothetical protein
MFVSCLPGMVFTGSETALSAKRPIFQFKLTIIFTKKNTIRSNIEAKMHDIAILYHVFLSFNGHLAGLLAGRFTP